MIKLKEACEIAKRYLETRDLFIRNTCRDFGDSWIFDWGWKNAPDEIDTGGSLVRVSKDNGRVTIFVLGVSHEENFKRFMKAHDIDISEYIYSQRCLKMKLENREKDLYCPILSKKYQ